MTGHTLGPWTVTAFMREADASAPTGRRARIVSSGCETADGYLVSAANASVADVKRRGGLADARLIAAAPDLLAACEAVVKWVRGEQGSVESLNDLHAICAAAIRKARTP